MGPLRIARLGLLSLGCLLFTARGSGNAPGSYWGPPPSGPGSKGNYPPPPPQGDPSGAGGMWGDDQYGDYHEDYEPYPDERGNSRGGRGGDRARVRPQGRVQGSDRAGRQEMEDSYEGDDEDLQEVEDLVVTYRENLKGKLVVTAGSCAVGSALGAIISKSTVKCTPAMALAGLVVGLVMSFLRGAFGDLFRASGLALMLSLPRSRSLARSYPLFPYIKRSLGMGQRMEFPPNAPNPWSYKQVYQDDPEFGMLKVLLAQAFIGLFIGYIIAQIPVVFLPTFLVALVSGGFFAYIATLKTPQGDLSRVFGMRTVAYLGLIKALDKDVMVSRKFLEVCSICVSTALFWDRKFKIKEKLFAGLGAAYNQLMIAVNRARGDMGEEEDYEEEDELLERPPRPPPKPRSDRRGPALGPPPPPPPEDYPPFGGEDDEWY
ncbi:unnamed protein product [Chrysoparadoxa australica]